MKKVLVPIVSMAMMTVMLLFPVNAALSDNNTLGVDANGNKKYTDASGADCASIADGNCNSNLDPFATDTNKHNGNGDKKNTDASASGAECTSKADDNCSTTEASANAASTPDNGRISNSKGADIAKIVFVDYGRPPQSIHNGPAGDVCGDGTGKYATLSGGIRWNSFPVPYSIDASSSGIDSTAAKSAVKAAFKTIDDEQHPSGDFFVLTTSNPKITVKWANMDGPGNALAQTTTYYNTASKTIIKADIVFDSGDKWGVNSNYGCGGGGSSFDVQDVGTHELGHAIGLGHVADNLLTMYKYASPGETLKSSLGRGDQRGIDRLY